MDESAFFGFYTVQKWGKVEPSEVAIDIEIEEYAWTCDENLKSTIKIAERMKIMKGYKVSVCGSVESGKSSLFCSILGFE